MFAVGDEKQSIFSFQGAAPREFDALRELKQKFEDAGLKFDPSSFTYSFRSGPAILEAVDQCSASRGDLSQHPCRRHRSIRCIEALPDAAPGLIDLWDAQKPTRGRTSRAGTRRSTASP